jgi:hypothetical protein
LKCLLTKLFGFEPRIVGGDESGLKDSPRGGDVGVHGKEMQTDILYNSLLYTHLRDEREEKRRDDGMLERLASSQRTSAARARAGELHFSF